jgi:hypothetical protein
MHEMNDEVILRNLAQESPKSELRWRRYDQKSFGDLSVISEKWLGLYLEIFLDSRGFVSKIGGLHLDFRLRQAVLCKRDGDFLGCIYFPMGNAVDLVHGSRTSARRGPRWTEDRATTGSLPERLLMVDSGHRGSP